jgi:hypothetical protein
MATKVQNCEEYMSLYVSTKHMTQDARSNVFLLFLFRIFECFVFEGLFFSHCRHRVITESHGGVIGVAVSYSGGSVFNSRPADRMS